MKPGLGLEGWRLTGSVESVVSEGYGLEELVVRLAGLPFKSNSKRSLSVKVDMALDSTLPVGLEHLVSEDSIWS
jgi:hypothetical protein